MVKIEYPDLSSPVEIPVELLEGKRPLTYNEIQILEKNLNHNSDPSWKNFFVDEEGFDPSLIHLSFFSGFIILGKLEQCTLHYNDLVLECGIRRSRLSNIVTGDNCVIRNVYYLDNYRLGDRVILFNIQEMCCTKHSKFGVGILKEGEPEEHRIWIGVANENDGRRVLPFENLIPADAYIWSHYREDKALLKRFVELTEYGQSKKLDTYGFIDDDCVIKNSNIIKDTKVGKAAYIKGVFKLKNVTIQSSEEEPSQIGEGVEMVNGILGYGSRVFYQAIAVRFVIGRNCQVKYGARLLNSVLGDNSTVSCCEILNNLIYPFHEQHHNSSFLIATTVMGQSNIAAGANIGSNHNSRSPDGEIFAKRGFWPGLCSDFKHNSRFASFVLVSKGSYQNELDISYPFSLVSPGMNGNQSISIFPAWLFLYDMFAITRNNNKFKKRDKRKVRVQQIETDPLAPDTLQEIEVALRRIIELTAEYLVNIKDKKALEAKKNYGLRSQELYQVAKDFLHQNQNASFTLNDREAQKKYGAIIVKPVKAYKMYRRIAKFFAVRTLCEYCKRKGLSGLTKDEIKKISEMPLFTEWVNVGGQIIPQIRLDQLFEMIKEQSVDSWDSIHDYYNGCQAQYEDYKVAYALNILEKLYSRDISEFTPKIFNGIIEDVKIANKDIYDATLISRMKDFDDEFRMQTFRNAREMTAVLGSITDNEFIQSMKSQAESLEKQIEVLFSNLI